MKTVVAGAQNGAIDPFTAECQAVGRESAAAGLRIDQKAPAAYRDAYLEYQGPRTRLTYFDTKVLSLRLSAVRRGMLVDPSVTGDLLERMTDGRCPVTRQKFKMGGGQSPSNPSVDRLVNEVSYRAGNICVLSQLVNRAKGELTFEEVSYLAESGARHQGLAPVEWMRLTSLMYGAWARAHKQADPYLLPLAVVPGPGLFTSTSQVVQMLLTRHFGRKGAADDETRFWLSLTEKSGCEAQTFLTMRDLLVGALKVENYAGDAWLHGEVFESFVSWYNACSAEVVPAVEASLERQQQRVANPVAVTQWPDSSRYHH